ncbi:hypothetical protein [Ktedonospora formicarum]|uniref:Uncharacterized protein n=1 Tax=Ktedonospora formicarum TaxID=2778364 RepID=A0A8J3IA28_9CHLR|nr:hypothetical protein [Ktedonospora formicarum]GHO48498.1 hypothetical protein KSX_66610 [Ktedonospora formicarum]
MKLSPRVAGIGLIVALLLVVLVLGTNLVVQGGSLPQPHGFTPPAHTTPLGRQPAIIPAQEKLQINALPTYGKSEVDTYLKDHYGENLLPYTVSFISPQDATKKIEATFEDTAAIVCYVEFQGVPSDMAQNPVMTNSVTPDTNTHPRKALTHGFMLFDGASGDLIVSGAGA